jgi:hypothetical protein
MNSLRNELANDLNAIRFASFPMIGDDTNKRCQEKSITVVNNNDIFPMSSFANLYETLIVFVPFLEKCDSRKCG